ncbi:hypothetical protein K466DRAFT_597729 [Polyporus arcularius HHB13444]|uniref:Uncharacterized protein n=1 Tax=Polyporus arcularius HHB13444 TaxID=1314778 RepID=A0A5C3PIV5_9APHY|nr:hypothetical protein K466DRAFT_597729 [Polyporus arcularius HHB13444]
MFVRARANSYSTPTYIRRHVPRSEHPHDFRWHTHDYIQESASPSATPNSNDPTDAIIGAAAAGSVVFLIGAIFLGYWLTKRRARRRCPPSQIWISSESRPVLEAPRKARKHSIILVTPSTVTRPPPLWIEKPLPSTPLTASLLPSSYPSSAAPATTPFSSEKATSGPYSEKSSETLTNASTISSPPPTHLKLGLVRPLSIEKIEPDGSNQSRTVPVAQEVDSGVRLGDQVIVPPPYTFR